MVEQYPFTVYNEVASEDLSEILELSNRLGELDFPALPDEQVKNIECELCRRL